MSYGCCTSVCASGIELRYTSLGYEHAVRVVAFGWPPAYASNLPTHQNKDTSTRDA